MFFVGCMSTLRLYRNRFVSESNELGVHEVHVGPDNFGWLAGVDDARAYLDAVWAMYRSMNTNRQDIGIAEEGRASTTTR